MTDEETAAVHPDEANPPHAGNPAEDEDAGNPAEDVRAQSIPGTGSDLSATKVGTEGVPGAGAHVRGPELESNESEFRSDWSNVLEQE